MAIHCLILVSLEAKFLFYCVQIVYQIVDQYFLQFFLQLSAYILQPFLWKQCFAGGAHQGQTQLQVPLSSNDNPARTMDSFNTVRNDSAAGPDM